MRKWLCQTITASLPEYSWVAGEIFVFAVAEKAML
jgi:hypothetical protein